MGMQVTKWLARRAGRGENLSGWRRLRGTVTGLLILACVVAALSHRDVSAGVVFYSNQTAFDHAGTILQTGNFDDFGPGFHSVADPFARGGLSYTSIRVIGPNTVASNGNPPLVWNPIRPVPLFPFSPTIYGSIDVTPTTYNMFGFQLGYLNSFVASSHPPVTASIRLDTFSSSGYQHYNFTIAMPGSEESLAFSGFVTDLPDEYFTSFQITGPTAYFPGITATELGQVGSASVPEPSSGLIVGLGAVIGLLAYRRKLKVATRYQVA